MSAATELLAPWQGVAAKADAHFARIAAAFTDEISCREGCHDCCAPGLSVMLVEALAISAALASLPPALRLPIQQRARAVGRRCALLVDGRCAVYAARPLICRTHGLPVLEPSAGGDAPAAIRCCRLNFAAQDADRGPGGFPAAAILDGERLTAALVVADALVRQTLGVEQPLRVALRDLAREGVGALPPSLRRRLSGS